MAVRKDNLARKKVGYQLRIVQEFGPNKGQWERVGYLENTKSECLAYKDKHYPNVKKFSVTGVRFDARPVIDDKPYKGSDKLV